MKKENEETNTIVENDDIISNVPFQEKENDRKIEDDGIFRLDPHTEQSAEDYYIGAYDREITLVNVQAKSRRIKIDTDA